MPKGYSKVKKLDTNKLTQAILSKIGFSVYKIDYYDFFAKRSKDFLGFGDQLAMGGGWNIVVQTTSFANFSTRVNKIVELDSANSWAFNGGSILVLGWKRGDKTPRALFYNGEDGGVYDWSDFLQLSLQRRVVARRESGSIILDAIQQSGKFRRIKRSNNSASN